MPRNKDKKKVEFQIEPELYTKLVELAERDDRSVASLVRQLLAKEIRESEALDEPNDERETS